ncbi:MAG: hypothetical protein JST00_13285 [Deltaproteobacteria bacterium]|nr:hypothetical protein [Deltaproteobacteria bacterium]
MIDLLHSVDCTVAVSSKVDNPKDFPEHLVDGKNETAWNGRTGDLGGFIAFRVPKVTRVKRIELTVGFVKTGPKGDLFTMNHRIEKVRLTREGALVKEVTLDPDDRRMQGFDVDEAGGDFELRVLATKPGTEKSWKELVVSELRVLGLANGAPENPSHLPKMAIGGLDGVTPRPRVAGAPPPGPFPTTKELCAAYDGTMAASIKKAFPGDRYPGEITPPHCKPVDDPRPSTIAAAVAKGPFKGGQFLRVHDASESSVRLALETSKGVSLTPVTLSSRFHDDPGCGHASEARFEDATLLTSSTGRETLVVRIVRTDVYWLGSTNPGGTVEEAYACSADTSGAASCEGPKVVGKATGWPHEWDVANGSFPPVDLTKTHWDFRRMPSLGPAGDLR